MIHYNSVVVSIYSNIQFFQLFQFESHVSRVCTGLSKLGPCNWKKFTDALRGIDHSNDSKIGPMDKIREWFRENAYLAADKLTKHVNDDTLDASNLRPNDPFDIRLTVLARSCDVIGKEPSELEDCAKIEIARDPADPSKFFHLYTIAEPMPLRNPEEKVSVIIRKDVLNRGDNPDVKDANFVRKRQILIDCQGKSEETIMAETGSKDVGGIDKCSHIMSSLPPHWKSTIITEGSSSNFFAVYRVAGSDSSFILRTAGNDKVLGGTVRELLMERYIEHPKDPATDAPIQLNMLMVPPTVDDIHDWVGCFIASTSRLVLPIDEVILPIDSGSTNNISTFLECNGDRSWPEEETKKVEEEKKSTTAVVYRFDTTSPLMKMISNDAKVQILAHSTSVKRC